MKTLQRWDREGRLKAKRTVSGRRYYDETDLAIALNLPQRPGARRIIAYCRVSSPAQRPDLYNQRAALERYTQDKQIVVDEWVMEIGGGLNFERKRFLKLVDAILAGEVERVVIVEGAFSDLGQAYANFFAGRGNYPNYKKKGKSRESFYLSTDKITVGSHWIAIPGLGRFILDGRKQERDRRKQVVCEEVKILGATVSCEAGHWYVSIQVEIKRERPSTPERVVGVDVGLKQAALVSDGRRLENQRPLALHLKKLGKPQRKLSKKQKTKDPETKRCSCCGHVKKRMPLKHRTYRCHACGLVIDRDLNAALNLEPV